MLVDPAFIVSVEALMICPYAPAAAKRKAPVGEKYCPNITSDPIDVPLISMLEGLSSFGINESTAVPRDLTKRKLAPESKGFMLDENRANIGKFEVVVASICAVAPPSELHPISGLSYVP